MKKKRLAERNEDPGNTEQVKMKWRQEINQSKEINIEDILNESMNENELDYKEERVKSNSMKQCGRHMQATNIYLFWKK